MALETGSGRVKAPEKGFRVSDGSSGDRIRVSDGSGDRTKVSDSCVDRIKMSDGYGSWVSDVSGDRIRVSDGSG